MPSRERDVLPEGVVSIEDRAFIVCESLTSIVILESVTSIRGWAFYKCEGLSQITFIDITTACALVNTSVSIIVSHPQERAQDPAPSVGFNCKRSPIALKLG